ncbi:hypothetical protein JXA70_10890 [candidate division KSB1 bacterium]|nr:hypothetical protein [candidate division KSB1 bacterium]
MKHLFVLLLFSSMLPLVAKEQTLVSGHVDHGGYGGPVFKFTQIGPNNDGGFLMGGQGGWIIDHKLVIGGGGYGLVNNVNVNWYEVRTFDGEPQPHVLDFGYGGLLIAFISNSDDLIHYEIFSILGGGGVDYRLKNELNDEQNGDGFFIAEPGINIVFNITSFFRVGVGGTYRFVQGVDLPGMTNSDLMNFSGQVVLKFGAF